MKRVLILRDSNYYGFQSHEFRKDQGRVIEDDRVYSRLLDDGSFEEYPTLATYWLQYTGHMARMIFFVDGNAHTFEKDKPKRISRRVFTKLAEPIAKGELKRVLVGALMPLDDKVRVLVIRDMGAGDVLIATALVRSIKEQFPKARIFFSAHKSHLCLLEGNPDIEETFHVGEVNAFDFDYDINLIRRSEIHPECTKTVRAEMFANEAGIPLTRKFPALHLNVLDFQGLNLTETQKKRVAIQPRGSGTHRSIAPHVLKEVAEGLVKEGYEVLVYGQDADHFPWNMPGVHNFCGTLKNIRDAAVLIKQSDLLISPDSFGIHAAAALEVPTLALFTTIDPYLRLRDYPHCWPLMTEGITCQPCFDRVSCSGRYDCLNIGTKNILEKASRILNGLEPKIDWKSEVVLPMYQDPK